MSRSFWGGGGHPPPQHLPRAALEPIAALACCALPWRLCRDGFAPFMAVGPERDALFRALAHAERLRASDHAAVWLDPANRGLAWWLQAVLPTDGPRAWSVVVAISLWAAGFGAWRLVRARRPELHPAAALVAAACAQLGQVALRGVLESDVAALAVGWVALGLAHPALGWIAALWSLPGAVAMGLAALADGAARAWWPAALRGVAAAAGLALCVGTPPAPDARPVAPAYVGDNRAVLPLPREEAERVRAGAWLAGTGTWLAAEVPPRRGGNPHAGGAMDLHGRMAPPVAAGAHPSPDAPPPSWGDALVPLQRVHVGIVAAIGLLAALAARPSRRVAGAALVGWVGLVVCFGYSAAPGELERDPQAAARLAGVLGAGRGAWGGAAAWAAACAAPAALGVAQLVGWMGARTRVGAALFAAVLLVAGPALENPRLGSFVTHLPPDPVVDALRGLPPGAVLVAPRPDAPWLQGQRAAARVAWELARTGHPPAPANADTDATVAVLAALSDTPVDITAGPRAWASREHPGFSGEGWRYLLVEEGAVPAAQRGRLQEALIRRAGPPVVTHDGRQLHDLSAFTGRR
ncbi:MAG: hypothetical protein RLZZ299_1906 [Pseudomonadota bacterium]